MSKTSPQTSTAYRALLLCQTPLIDVRAPVEFAKGALPFAINLPFINNEERHLIGICYQEKGQQEAISLGHQLLSGDKKKQRVNAWVQFLEQHPNALLYCARGGLRSELSQQWLAEIGVDCVRIEGGYKSLRTFLLRFLDEYCSTETFTILSGMTGTGKTDIIKNLDNSIDLERHANHKGSSFGRPLTEQPTQVNFENNIILDLLRVSERYPNRQLILEDESRNIGGRYLPEVLNNVMNASNIVVIDLPFEQRIEKLWKEYVVQRYEQTIAHHQGNRSGVGEQAFSDYLIDSLMRVQKRLGSQRTNEILALMKAAIERQQTDKFCSHKEWLSAITRDYYDPMYLYQLDKRVDRVVFRGDHQSVLQWLQEHG